MSKIKPENFFLFISIIFGLLYVFTLPPFQSVDEKTHFYRSYAILDGILIPQVNDGQVGSKLPKNVIKLANSYDYLVKNINAKTSFEKISNSNLILNTPEREFATYQNTALYSPVAYITQLPGMFVAKSMNATPLTVFYAGRLSNLFFWTLIIYFSIKIIPFFKLPLLLIACAPMTMSLAGALTVDVTVIAFSILWISIILKLAFDKKIEGKDLFLLGVIAIILALSKHFILLLPLIFLIPMKKIKNKFGVFLILLLAILALFSWQYCIKDFSTSLSPQANADGQFHFISENLLQYISVLIHTFFVKFGRILITMIGVLGWQDTRLDFITYITYPILMYFAIATDTDKFSFTGWQTSLLVLVSVLSYVVIATLLYLTWSPVGASVITGLNGKYFIPVLLPFLLIFHERFRPIANTRIIIYIAIVLILLSSDLSLLHRFYGLTPNLYYAV